MKDYSRRYSSVGGRQKIHRRNRGVGSADSGLLWKVGGVMALIGLVVGVGAGLWMGWQIDSGLEELGDAKKLRQEEIQRNNALLAGWNKLRSQEEMEVAAALIGLYPPTNQQVRRP